MSEKISLYGKKYSIQSLPTNFWNYSRFKYPTQFCYLLSLTHKIFFYLNKLHYLVPGFKKILVRFLLFPLVFYLVGIKFLFISKVGKKFWFIYLVGIKTDFYSYQRNKLEFFSHLGNKQVIFSHLRKIQVKNKNFTVILSLVSPIDRHPNTAVVNGTVALYIIKHSRYDIQLQKI